MLHLERELIDGLLNIKEKQNKCFKSETQFWKVNIVSFPQLLAELPNISSIFLRAFLSVGLDEIISSIFVHSEAECSQNSEMIWLNILHEFEEQITIRLIIESIEPNRRKQALRSNSTKMPHLR